MAEDSKASVETKTGSVDGMQAITEGKATILYEKAHTVFYNKVQEFNRDLSIACITEFATLRKEEIAEKNAAKAKRRREREEKEKEKGSSQDNAKGEGAPSNMVPEAEPPKGVRILEALSATGLRSIRYWKEIENGLIDEIIANDLSETAVKAIEQNCRHNDVPLDRVKPNQGDACEVLYSNRSIGKNSKGFDVIDLDPYGSAAEFLDGAVQAVSDGGLLCVTCTDKAVLCGRNTETCYGKYAATSMNAGYCHEMAVRIVLQAIERSANRYKRHIIPLLSMSIDFYVRVFVRVKHSPFNVKFAASKIAHVYQSLGCDAFYVQPHGSVDDVKKQNPKFRPALGPPCDSKCEFTGSRMKLLGPIWAGPLHDKEFVSRVISHVESHRKKYGTEKRMVGQLRVCKEELDIPLYYVHEKLVRLVRVNYKITLLRSAILNAGYKVSQSHSHPSAIKTDAPPNVIMDILRSIVLKDPEKGKSKRGADTPGGKIMATPPQLKVDFTLVPEAEGLHAAFFPNPEENWGPKARATGGKRKNLSLQERREMNQNKRSRKKAEEKTSSESCNSPQNDAQPKNSS